MKTKLLNTLERVIESKYCPALKFVLGFAILASLPVWLDVYFLGYGLGTWIPLSVLIVTLIWAFTGQAWNIMSGFTGMFSFGHAAFFGLGAYTTMKLVVDYGINPWFGMFVGGFLASLLGVFIGYLTFRFDVKGHYFALATLAFAELTRSIIENWAFLNDVRGYFRPFPREYAEGPGLVAFQFQSELGYYYLILGFLALITIVTWGIRRSAIGYYFFAIREDEDAARSLGIPTLRYKLLGITVSAFFTAWAGSFWSMYFSTIEPGTVFNLTRNVEILLPAIIGGFGTITGPIYGALMIVPFAEVLRQSFELSGLHLVIYGIFVIVIVIYNPRGIAKWIGDVKRYALRRFRKWAE